MQRLYKGSRRHIFEFGRCLIKTAYLRLATPVLKERKK
ncbi:hypothetical protein NIES3585_26920 [Nodularia sp. NIES-3585]|nr:hypothetical protein NIES3585_26920 [Nodularia sp. NIES-3585]